MRAKSWGIQRLVWLPFFPGESWPVLRAAEKKQKGQLGVNFDTKKRPFPYSSLGQSVLTASDIEKLAMVGLDADWL